MVPCHVGKGYKGLKKGVRWQCSIVALLVMSEKKRGTSKFISDKWSDPTYRAAFSGVDNFRKAVNKDFNLSLTRKEVIAALSVLPGFVNNIRQKKVTHFRKYDIRGSFDTWQADLAFMPKYGRVTGFLTCVDIGSRKIYTRTITTKSVTSIRKKLEDIFEKDCDNFTPVELITDAGKEFIGLKKFFEEKNIWHKIIRTVNKAAVAESSISLIKKRLFLALQTLDTKNWPSLLDQIVLGLNSTENKAIGGIKPGSIETPFDNYKLDKVANKRPYKQPHWDDQVNAQNIYEKNINNLQIGDLVLVKREKSKTDTFKKGYQLQVS